MSLPTPYLAKLNIQACRPANAGQFSRGGESLCSRNLISQAGVTTTVIVSQLLRISTDGQARQAVNPLEELCNSEHRECLGKPDSMSYSNLVTLSLHYQVFPHLSW